MQLQDLLRDYGRTLAESLAGCCFLAATWAAQRTKRWLLEHVEREKLACAEMLTRQREAEMRRHNETLRIACEASANVEPPTLESLLGSERLDFSLESLPESSIPPPPPNRAFTPRPPLVAPSLEPIDWSDDEEITTVPETPHSKGTPPNER